MPLAYANRHFLEQCLGVLMFHFCRAAQPRLFLASAALTAVIGFASPSVSMVVTADSGYQSNLYNSNGAYSGLTSPGTLTATTVSVSGVPEVSTLPMMLAGFAALGFTGYRRNKKAAVAA
jgi:hypothetical protein